VCRIDRCTNLLESQTSLLVWRQASLSSPLMHIAQRAGLSNIFIDLLRPSSGDLQHHSGEIGLKHSPSGVAGANILCTIE